MPVDDAPEDDEVRETYNFPPGAFGLVYRAVVPDTGLREDNEGGVTDGAGQNKEADANTTTTQDDATSPPSFQYELKAMKWGLIPFWTKRSPDYGSMIKTINCRDDSLIENRGMWNTMKQRKRCIVVAQGFYEWLKKGPGGKEKIPHFVKRKDGNLMCFAGLWDCVKYEDAEEKLYSYSIITTDSNKQLNFLHDRMPVILDPQSEAMKLWLDPTHNKWTKDLQAILKPYDSELECYPVNKEVGKVGNNSPDFILPLDSKDNKKNIANFFDNAAKKSSAKVEHEKDEERATKNHDSTEDHAPIPVPDKSVVGHKRKHEEEVEDSNAKVRKENDSQSKVSPLKTVSSKKNRSSTSNEGSTLKNSPAKKSEAGAQKITNFFVK